MYTEQIVRFALVSYLDQTINPCLCYSINKGSNRCTLFRTK